MSRSQCDAVKAQTWLPACWLIRARRPVLSPYLARHDVFEQFVYQRRVPEVCERPQIPLLGLGVCCLSRDGTDLVEVGTCAVVSDHSQRRSGQRGVVMVAQLR